MGLSTWFFSNTTEHIRYTQSLTYYRNIAGYTQYSTTAIFCGAWNLKILSKHAFILSELNRNNPLLYKGTSLLLQRREVNNFTQGISALLRFKFGDSCFSTINLHMKPIIDMWITILIKTSSLLIVCNCGNTCFVQAGNCDHQLLSLKNTLPIHTYSFMLFIHYIFSITDNKDISLFQFLR